MAVSETQVSEMRHINSLISFAIIAVRKTFSHPYITLLFSVLLQYLLKRLDYILCGLKAQ